MRLFSWNVNGIRAIARKNFMEWFEDTNPDILCLQETKAQRDQVPKKIMNIEGYEKYFSQADKKGYSGVGLITKPKPNDVKHGFGIEEFDNEGRVIIADYDKFVLFTIYYPNGSRSDERLDYKLRFYDEFLSYADDLVEKGRYVIFCGDVNTAHNEIDLARPKANEKNSGFLPIERKWMDKMVSHGYIDTYRFVNGDKVEYSWWDYKTRARERNVGWRLDYFFVSGNLKDKIVDAKIHTDVMGSDHCPVELEIGL
ncbi:MAG: exodeoxyribonuclease III [Candidatus Zixiibacteriota bacterium]